MRELERTQDDIRASTPAHTGTGSPVDLWARPVPPERGSLGPPQTPGQIDSIALLGRGRLGRALTAALRQAGQRVDGPLARNELSASPVVLLCVPDSEIAGNSPRALSIARGLADSLKLRAFEIDDSQRTRVLAGA